MRKLKEHRRAAVFFAAGIALGAAGTFLFLTKPWTAIAANFREREKQDQALSPLIEQARSWSLSYENVSAGATGDIGKPVVWCVDHHVKDESFIGGNANWKVRWIKEDDVPISGDTKHGCQDMVAVVRGSDSNGVLLEYKGQP